MENYQEHYRLLGIKPGDSWQKLRGAYKTQMRRWHPDRFGQNDPARRQAEEKTKQINRAYQELCEFYEQHDRLPLQSGPPISSVFHAHASQADTAAKPEPTTSSTQPVTSSKQGQGNDYRMVFVVAFMSILAGILLWNSDRTDPSSEPASTQSAPAPLSNDPARMSGDTAPVDKRFSIGSTLGEVYSIQGVPSRVEGDTWHYGEAIVFFQNGRVTHWTDSKPSQLKARHGFEVSPVPPAAYFIQGSSKDEVRAIQGAPLRESEETWEYGSSRIYFDRNGRVSHWQESPFEPLRIKR